MRLSMLHGLLWLLPALITSTREMVSLQPGASVSAACGQRATLECAVASSLDKLSIKHMEWSLNQASLCSVDARESVTTHSGNTTGRFHCEYARGRLLLVLHEVRPNDAVNSDYMCKLKSNRGAKHMTTKVELQECCGDVQTRANSGAATCTFRHVHGGRDVHWFHGHRGNARLHEDIDTTSLVDGDGWWTITSSLQHGPSHKAFNCSLISRSGRYLRSASVRPPPSRAAWAANTGGSLPTSTWPLLWASINSLCLVLI